MNSKLNDIEFKLDQIDSSIETSFMVELSTIKELLMVLVKRDTNDRNNSEEGGDKDGQVHEDHNGGVDGDPLS
ncbi:hypothetical protein E5676_scaffold263G00590 [Cucumis melo var. makuwa]|uniref:Uncharacterized protein n=1 Tax=Cucumis melo var. makuwa TaxID=1194695 RepID=A0A5A7SNG0_CUCMM|nr:hypothetical protein E6C27_scaffold19G001060 [Cucumis melo var. makuwa]TYK11613.1 hypothetical protein E5676_scaffold263G00590 [Cucumis melo var. makuwa]